MIHVECWNVIGDIGAAVRSSTRKPAELADLAVARWGTDATTGLVWVVRATARKREIAATYLEHFRDCEHVTLPVERPGCQNVYWMFGILINDSFGRTKDEVMAALKERGVDSRSFFYPMSQQRALRGDDPRLPNLKGRWPVSADLARRGLYLPSGIGLTADQIRYCAETLKSLRR